MHECRNGGVVIDNRANVNYDTIPYVRSAFNNGAGEHDDSRPERRIRRNICLRVNNRADREAALRQVIRDAAPNTGVADCHDDFLMRHRWSAGDRIDSTPCNWWLCGRAII